MSESGLSARKRQRTVQACQPCRKRKSKCGGELPACLVCTSSKRTCTYDSSSRRRGLQTGYVRGLEALLGLILREAPREEHKIRMMLRSQDVDAWSSGDARAAHIWRKSGLSRDLERLLAGSEDAAASSPESLSPLSSPDGDLERARNALSVREAGEMPPLSLRTTEGDLRDLYQQVLPSQTSDLVDFYFTYIHCWFPILERRDILRLTYSDTPVHGLTSGDKGLKICLWAIVVLVSGQKRLQPEAVPSSPYILTLIRRQISEHDQSPELGFIQATLIVVMIKAGQGHFEPAWVLVGQAARMLLIHQQRSPRHTHTLLGCLMLDNFLSALLGKKPYFPPNDQLAHGSLSEDSLEEWEVWNPPSSWMGTERTNLKRPLRAISTFNIMSRLMERLTRVSVSPLDAARQEDSVSDLRNWKANLPAHYQLHDMSASNPALLNLHLMWNFVMCSLLLRTARVDANILDLAKQTAGSTVEILGKASGEVGASSPLLLGYAVQAWKCMKALTQLQPDNTASLLIMRLEAIQGSLRQDRKFGVHEDPSTIEHIQPALQPTPAESYAPTRQLDSNSAPPSQHLSPNDMLGDLRQGPGLRSDFVPFDPDRFSDNHSLSGIDRFSDVNDFDALLEGMPFLVPVERRAESSA
ncbi:hypothetical protein A1O3_08421 [Capronia epimyces CBS 606.96]|uniref:Zn(2)-C6 fungal-type domain-containing protein n=1 Tax=Capronia epimyces CBS 606.96 TaxID=1182542 RepID=W9XPN8_9EURO|nr:uncharacterized protein A1O3_08421 [Capronia epimyces CBS 606.96]EXJ78921.1 hypothetical protein A1O3_08421 [Capronia epimyces CBS 606.96]